MPELPRGSAALCVRCGAGVGPVRAATVRLVGTLSAALGGFLLFWPALHLPIMTVRKLGFRRESGLWEGCLSLLTGGHAAVGVLVLVFSVILPPLKLAGLAVLSAGALAGHPPRGAAAHRLIDAAGRWGMLDVLLLAVLAAWVKLGEWVEIRAGPGLYAFAGCVLLSLVASALFDPHAVWGEEPLS